LANFSTCCNTVAMAYYFINSNKKPSCRYDSRPYCPTADYLVISDCC